MQIDSQRHGAVTVIRPTGPVTTDDATQLKVALQDAMREARGRIVLDAASFAYADSAALEVLADAGESLLDTGQPMRVACVNETLRTVFELVELDHLFEHYEDVNGAVRSFL